VRADAGQTQVIVDSFPDQQKIWPDMTSHIADPDAANGLHVPRDISVVGFDNYELSKHSNPPLTTIDVPAEEMGGAAADYLLNTLEGEEVPSHRSVDVQLILRDSSAPPPPRGARSPVQLPGDHLPTNDSA